jgi:hypothetical protein
MKSVYLLPVLLLALALSGCATGANTSVTQTVKPDVASTQQPQTTQVQPAPALAGLSGELARTDAQGAVQVKVTPLNLVNPGETLDFDVDMNTHSVDLGMNLAELATLTTDIGQKVTAKKWEAPGGGHHVVGKLLFPSTVDGKPLLKGATKVTLSLRNIDAAERVFSWNLK